MTDQTSAHDPLSYLPEGIDLDDWHDYAEKKPEEFTDRARESIVRSTSRRWSASSTRAPRSSTTATRCAARPSSAATRAPSPSPASCRRTSARSSARARGRSAGPRSRATRADIARDRPGVLDLFPENEPLRRWITKAQERVAFQGLPARICWLGYGERDKAGVAFNDLVASRAR